MFNFHKPRVYRSTEGCCICRAKSSSSRFTDSRKYENESMQCFNLKYPRHGEICNACVLLVKRYKRLPVGNKRHWGHVVDARAGPGTKSLAKQKKRDEWGESSGSSKSFIPEKFAKIFKKNRNGKTKNSSNNYKTTDEAPPKSKLAECSDNPSDSNESYDESTETACGITYTRQGQVTSPPLVVQFQTQTRAAAQKQQLAAASASARAASTIKLGSKRRRMLPPMKHRRNIVDNGSFFERENLLKLEICCGVIYQYAPMADFVIIDADEYRPCEKHRKLNNTKPMTVATFPVKLETATQQQQQQQTQNGVNLPAVVRLAPVTVTGVAATVSTSGDGGTLIKHTPALKKHHLFYKRQSECFPNVDVNQTSPQTTIPLPTQTPSTSIGEASTMVTTYVASYMPRHSTNSSTLHEINTATTTSVTAPVNKSTHNLALVLKPCPVGGAASAQPQMPKALETHALTTAVGASSPSALSSSSSCSSTSSSSSATKFNDNSSDSGFDEHVQDRKSASPPSQDEHEKKPLTRSNGLQRLILASGLQISGQPQNLVLAGNEFAARLIQQRQQKPVKMTANKVNNVGSVVASVGGVVSLGSHNCGNTSASVNATTVPVNPNKKLRAIYNTNNTIQHENGVTTILPASSLAASNQTAAMNAIAPSTVTITPAPGGVGASVPKKIALNGHLQPLALNGAAVSSSASSNLSANSVAVTGSSQKIIFVKATTAAPTA